jgi:16S rRNA (uracil1498-N3)-methyltransferase
LNVKEVKENFPEFSPKLHIAIAPTKNIDRIEFFVEKATEMAFLKLPSYKPKKQNVKI